MKIISNNFSALTNVNIFKYLFLGGIFHDCMVHDIDLICWVLGEYPTEVLAAAHSFIPEIKEIDDHDTVIAIMKFKSGTIGSIDLSRNAVYGYDQRLEVGQKVFILIQFYH